MRTPRPTQVRRRVRLERLTRAQVGAYRLLPDSSLATSS
jgi:hypothetical protein